MSRDLTADMLTQSQASTLAPVLLAFFDFQGGAVRVWSGIGDLSWDSQTWVGLGHLGTVSPVEESADLRANGVAFELNGVPSSMISAVLGDNYQGRDVKLYLGAIDTDGSIHTDPYLLFSGRMDRMEIDDGAETAVVRVFAESRMVELYRNNERRYTHEDQQIDFSGDEGLAYMPTAQSTPFMWGGKRVPTYVETGGSQEVVDEFV